MSKANRPFNSARPSRRDFLKTSAAVSGAMAAPLAISRAAHAAGSDAIKIGLIGCGGRGSGAAINAMNAGKDVRLVAMADLFADRLQESRQGLKAAKGEQVAVDDAHCFVGFDAYRQVVDSADVVLIAAASCFHPIHLKAAVDAGKHVFCEKPHALDVPNLKAAMAAGEEAKKKNLCLVSGLCWRYDAGVRETMKRVLDGAIGRVVAIQETYVTSPYVLRPRQPGWSEIQYQMQNWYHFNWLSGDQTAQQLIHSLDKASWAMGDKPPVKAWGMGGRQVCVDPKYGDQFDHQAVVFEYADGARVIGLCRDQLNCHNETSDVLFGTKGRCDLLKFRIEGETNWRFEGARPSMYDLEHEALFAAIRAGKPLHNGNYMFLSTLLAIVAQMACYSGQEIAWEEATASTYTLAPPRYGWDIDPPVKPGPDGRYPTAMPGVTSYRA